MSTEEEKNVTETKTAEEKQDGAEKSGKMITLNVKTPKDKKTVQVEDNASIKDVSISWLLFCNLSSNYVWLLHTLS